MLKKCTQISKILNSAVTGVDFPLVINMFIKCKRIFDIDSDGV